MTQQYGIDIALLNTTKDSRNSDKYLLYMHQKDPTDKAHSAAPSLILIP
jgi:hypothetical protein